MKHYFPLITTLKTPRSLIAFTTVSGGLFYANYYMMANLPGERDFMCVIGAGLTTGNILFSLAISLLAGLIFAGLLQFAPRKGLTVGSTTTAGVGVGVLTTFCTLCTLPAISLFGMGIGLGFITDYAIYFKIASLILLGLSAYLTNRRLREGCLLKKPLLGQEGYGVVHNLGV